MTQTFFTESVSKDTIIDVTPQPSTPIKSQQTKAKGIEGNLDYVKMLKNDKLTVRIRTPRGKVVTGGLTEDFGIRLGNEWKNLINFNEIPLLGSMAQGIVPLIGAMSGASQMSMESLWMTTASWAGYTRPEIPISISLINYSESTNFFNDALSIADGALPPQIEYDTSALGDLSDAGTFIKDLLVGGAENTGKFIEENLSTDWMKRHNIGQKIGVVLTEGVKQIGVEAPCGYGLEASASDGYALYTPKANTTFAVDIGKWFSANRLLLKDCSFNFSKETLPNGAPIRLDMKMTFMPYQNISFQKFKQYFRLNSITIPSKSTQVQKGGSK